MSAPLDRADQRLRADDGLTGALRTFWTGCARATWECCRWPWAWW